MKKTITVLAIILSSMGISQEKLENSLLWKISGKNINTSYLFGTIHATCDNSLDEKVLNALKDTKNLYLELDMDDMAMQMKATQHMMMNDGKTIKSITTEEEYKLLDSFLTKETGMSLAMFNTVKPFFISSTILPKMLDCPMKSVEAGLMAQVKTENEEVYGLEKIEDQFAAFDAVPLKEQIKELVNSAKEGIENSKKEFKKLMEVYDSENIELMLEQTANKEGGMFTKYVDNLLNNRNKNWIEPIINACEKEPSFFGVGAAHLAGEKGVIKLLRKKGYTVEAVK